MSRLPRATSLAVLVAVAAVAVQALLVPLFAGPAANLEPRDLPVAVAGPAPAADQLAARLAAAHPGAFDVRVVADADAAIRNRDVYGAIVLGPQGPSLHVASAAGPAVASLLTQATATLGEGRPVPVVDVVPNDADDPRGAGFGSGFLPLAMTSLVAGILTFLLVRRRGDRLLALGTFAVLAGLVGAAVQQYWLGVLPGDYLSNAAVMGLFGLAVAGTVAGLAAVLDRAGLALGALTVFLVGNALSGVSSAAELLPQPWGTVGQYLPIGAGSTLLRSVAYFDGNGAGTAIWVLCAYAIGGLVLVSVGRRGLAGPTAEVAPVTAEREPALAG
ncbi:hypothetical protein ACIBSW_04350 [Actinoplanes sp. NPDC049668]|uniref:ABC transporter permease n=1 Tax=unclassified Actinoplanes TaxID=2626549 RepID=UPI0033B2D265